MTPELRTDDLDRLRAVERDVKDLQVETAKQSVSNVAGYLRVCADPAAI